MQYRNLLPSPYSQLKIQIVLVETESKEKLEELNKRIGNTSSTFNTQLNNLITTIEKNIEEVKNTIPNKLKADLKTVKTNASRVHGIESSILSIPSDLNTERETVKANSNKVFEIESPDILNIE
jgi:predicted DNA-binding protein